MLDLQFRIGSVVDQTNNDYFSRTSGPELTAEKLETRLVTDLRVIGRLYRANIPALCVCKDDLKLHGVIVAELGKLVDPM